MSILKIVYFCFISFLFNTELLAQVARGHETANFSTIQNCLLKDLQASFENVKVIRILDSNLNKVLEDRSDEDIKFLLEAKIIRGTYSFDVQNIFCTIKDTSKNGGPFLQSFECRYGIQNFFSARSRKSRCDQES